MNETMTEAHQKLGTFFRDTGGETENWLQIALATERFRAIELSCRACDACGAGAGCWAWIPGGGLRYAQFPPPTSDCSELNTVGTRRRRRPFLDL